MQTVTDQTVIDQTATAIQIPENWEQSFLQIAQLRCVHQLLNEGLLHESSRHALPID